MTASRRSWARLTTLAFVLVIGLVGTVSGGLHESPAGADTDSGTLVGEGGTFLEPVVSKLYKDDSAALAPIDPSYTNVDLDVGISDFIGSGSDQFSNDFAVSERPLTTAEAQTAKTDGRSFAYVPIAATPVAIATLVPTSSYLDNGFIQVSDLCPHIPLTVDQLGDIFGYDASQPYRQWNDSRIQNCTNGDGLSGVSISTWANLDPTMENSALMAVLDSDTTPVTGSKALFDAGIQQAVAASGSTCTTTPITNCDIPAENYPINPQNQVPGGDEAFLAKVMGISQTTNAPSNNASEWQLGATFPISSVWTGAPLGVSFDIPTAAVQNLQGAFVPPSEAAAAAAENDATLASTSDPTTNNLVTFNSSATDAAAYNNNLMVEDYLVVPTSGLPSAKATALAQLIRFALGTKGQADVSKYGSAPATPAMVMAGLKVAAQLNAEALADSATTTSSSTTTTTTTTTTTPQGTTTTVASGSSTTTTSAGAGSNATTQTTDGVSGGTSSDTSATDDSSGSLAFTGSNIWPLLAVGSAMVITAELLVRRLRRQRRTT